MAGHVFHPAVPLAVTGAVMLDLDDNAADFAVRKVQNLPNQRRVLPLPPYISDQHRQPAAIGQCVVTLLQAGHEHLLKSLVLSLIAQVVIATAVLDNVPVRRVHPHEIKLARQLLHGQVEAPA